MLDVGSVVREDEAVDGDEEEEEKGDEERRLYIVCGFS